MADWLMMFTLCRPQHHGSIPKATPWKFGRNRSGIWKKWLQHTKALGYYWWPIGSYIYALSIGTKIIRPWMTLKGHLYTALKHVCRGVVSYLFLVLHSICF